jgi:D-amino peptidase
LKKLFISADIEGCSAVASLSALMPDRFEWNAARRWMTMEVIAAAEAAFGAGYDEVIVADGHGNAHNIEPDLLPDNVRLIRSWPRPLLQMQGIDDEAIESCAFVGYHSHAAIPDSALAHTYSGVAFRSIYLNDVICSEGYLNAALAGEKKRPVIFVSGDQHTVKDAERYAPGAVRFVAKDAFGQRSISSLPPKQVAVQLKVAMSEALGRPLPPPFVVSGPYSLKIEMASPSAAEMLSYLPGVARIDAWTINVSTTSIEDAMKFISFATLYSPNGTPALS